MVYARRVPMDINSTSFSKSKSKAITELKNPDITKLVRGSCVRAFMFPRKPNSSPSLAIAYMQRGRENRDPKRVVVIPHSAPMDIYKQKYR